jgi:hypothetical protein
VCNGVCCPSWPLPTCGPICNHFSARKPDTCVIYPGTPVLGSLNVQGSYASCTRCSASTNRSWKA